MSAKLTIAILLSFLTLTSFGQDSRYNQLLEIAKKKAGLILHSKPAQVEKKLIGMKRYYDIRKPQNRLSDKLVDELIKTSLDMDSSNWKASDFSRTVVVESREDFINTSKILKEWNLTNKIEIKKYRKLLNKWTNSDPQARQINHISRPILSDNEEYGIILSEINEGYLCCRGKLTLYKYESGQWNDLGSIYNWSY